MSSIDREDRINDLIDELTELQEEHESGNYVPGKLLRALAIRVVDAEMKAEKATA